MSPKRASALTTIAIAAAVLLVIALASSISYEQAERVADRNRFPQIGSSVNIGGRTLNLDCSGAGQPTVIFESGSPFPLYNPRQMWERGAPRPGYSWVLVQRETAKFTRACWYDRAGSGWSDLGPYPRTSAAQARDLHALLQAARVPAPYVLVAEVSAALDARMFTSLYPSEVSGLVFADGIHPDLLTRARPGGGRYERVPKFVGHSQDLSAQIFNQIGFFRLAPSLPAPTPPPRGMTASEWTTIWHLTQAPKARSALLQEVGALAQSTAEVRAAGTLGDRPLVGISSETTFVPHSVWAELQVELSRLSPRGRLVEVKQATGDLIYQAPGTIVDAVRQVLRELNATTAHSPAARLRPSPGTSPTPPSDAPPGDR